VHLLALPGKESGRAATQAQTRPTCGSGGAFSKANQSAIVDDLRNGYFEQGTEFARTNDGGLIDPGMGGTGRMNTF
jgi:hypothetical protein